jgi:hypothetical protein
MLMLCPEVFIELRLLHVLRVSQVSAERSQEGWCQNGCCCCRRRHLILLP